MSESEKAEIERIAPPYAGSVPYGLTLDFEADMASQIKVIDSPSHPLRTEIDGSRAKISFSQQEAALDRDLVFIIETAEPSAMGVLAVEFKGREHVLLECIPSPLDRQSTPGHKTVVFLIDCSGSMQGSSIDQARKALELCVRALQPEDRFQIVRFGATWAPLWPQLQVFDQASLDDAVAKIHGMQADLGGTEILAALEGIESMIREGKFDLLLLTDGQVGNEAPVLAWAGRMQERCRIFSFGIGAGASESLVRGLARQSLGAPEFIFPGERMESKILRQFSRVGKRAVRDLEFNWGVENAEIAPRQTLQVFPGEPVIVAVRLPEGRRLTVGSKITMRGSSDGKKVTWTAEVQRSSPRSGNSAALWWARQAIRDLEENPSEPRRGSNQKRGMPAWQKQVIELSLDYGIISGCTSFLAIEERAADAKTLESAELRRVPVMITTGWHGGEADQGLLRYPVEACLNVLGGAALTKPAPLKSRGLLSRRCGVNDSDGEIDHRDRLSMNVQKSAKGYVGNLPQSAFAILTRQQAEGWFLLDVEMATLVSKTPAQVREWAAELNGVAGEEAIRIVSTLLAIHILRTTFANDQDLWKAGVTKAENWLTMRRVEVPGRGDPYAWLAGRVKA